MQKDLARALDELHRMQLRGLEGVADLVGAVAHEISSPLAAITSAADVSSRCAQRIRAIVATVGSTSELRQSSQFERALDLVEENSRLIQVAVQSVAEQTAVLREIAQSIPHEAPPALARILDEVLDLLEREPEGKAEFVRAYNLSPVIDMREAVLQWMLLEFFRHVRALAGKATVRVSVEPEQDRTVALNLEYIGADQPERHSGLARWVRRAGAELRSGGSASPKARVQLVLPCEASL